MNVPSKKNRCTHARRGALALIAMIALLLVSVIGASLLQSAVAMRRQTEREQWRLQAAWLAESALDRAAAKLRASPEYSGETWTLTAEDLGGLDGAVVTIKVNAAADRLERRIVSVVAHYPPDADQRAQAEKESSIDLIESSEEKNP